MAGAPFGGSVGVAVGVGRGLMTIGSHIVRGVEARRELAVGAEFAKGTWKSTDAAVIHSSRMATLRRMIALSRALFAQESAQRITTEPVH